MDFSDKLKQVRTQLSLSQIEFAKELGVAFTTINRWENGKFEPSYRALKKFDEFCAKNNIDFN